MQRQGEQKGRVGTQNFSDKRSWGFIIDYMVVEKQADVSLAIPLVERVIEPLRRRRNKEHKL